MSEREVRMSECEMRMSECEMRMSEREVRMSEREVRMSECEMRMSEREMRMSEREVRMSEREVRSELIYNISETGKLYFDETNLIIDNGSYFAAQVFMPRNEIRKLVFGTYTGIENTPAGNNIAVYPNPATNQLTIYNSGQQKIKEAEIFNIFGKKTGNYQLSTVDSKSYIDISNLPAGLYLIRLGNKTHKFVKR
jgi:hypothetical protein